MESATITDILQATENTGKSSLTQMEESAERAGLEGPREPEITGKSSLTQMEESDETNVPGDPGEQENTGKPSLTQMEGSAEMEELEDPRDPDKKISDSWEELEKLTDDEISASAGKKSGSLVTRGSGLPAEIQIDTNTEIEKPETDKQGGQTELSGRTTANQTGSDADDTPDNLPASRQQSDALESSQSLWWSGGLAWVSEKASSLRSQISGSPKWQQLNKIIKRKDGADANSGHDADKPNRAGNEMKEPEKRIAIFCRDLNPDTVCLVDHIIKLTDTTGASVMSYPFKNEWESQVRECYTIILLYSCSLHSEMEEYLSLRHCTPTRVKLFVIITDVEDSDETSMQTKLRKSWKQFSNSTLITLTQQDTASNNSKESPAIIMGRKVNMMIQMTSGNWFPRIRQLMGHEPINIGIFSRSDESDYSWLVNVLQSDYVNVTPCYISNSGFQQFRDAVSQCSFGILYHTKNRGRINVTDVTDSLYDEELKYLHRILGRDKVIVAIDDLQDSSNQAKDRILQSQPSISRLALDLFLFTEVEKNSNFRHHLNQTNSNQPNLEKKLKPLAAMFRDHEERRRQCQEGTRGPSTGQAEQQKEEATSYGHEQERHAQDLSQPGDDSAAGPSSLPPQEAALEDKKE